MSDYSRYGVPAFDRPHRMIKGVCAAAATMAGIPVWIVRVAAVVLLCVHCVLAVAGYLVLAYVFRCSIRETLAGGPPEAARWNTPPNGDDYWRGRRMP